MMEFNQFPPQQGNYSTLPAVPPAPVTPPTRVWSLGFILVLTFIALLGGTLTFFGVAAMNQLPGYPVDFYPGNLVGLLLRIGLLSACLAALGHVRSPLLRAGLLLQVAAATANTIFTLMDFQVIKNTPSTTLFFSSQILVSALNLLSLVCLSYGLARWQRSDAIFLPLQILLTLGLGLFMLNKLNPPDSIHIQLAISTFCDLAAILVLIARLACVKASPLIIFCLTVGNLLTLLYYVFAIGPFPTITDAQPFQIFYGLGRGAILLSLIGILILAQTERIKTPSSKPTSSNLPLPTSGTPG